MGRKALIEKVEETDDRREKVSEEATHFVVAPPFFHHPYKF